MIVLRELDVDFLLLADLSADELLLEARDEAAGTDLQRIVLALAALESLAIDKALEVERREVAISYGRAFRCVNHLALAILHSLQLLVHVLIRDCLDLLLNLQALVVTELDLRTRRNRCLEDEILALFQRHDVDLRARHRLELLLVECLVKGFRCEVVLKGIVQDIVLAEMRLHDLARSLALAETRDIHTVSEALAGTLNSFLYFCCFHFDGESYLLVLAVFCRYFHCLK